MKKSGFLNFCRSVILVPLSLSAFAVSPSGRSAASFEMQKLIESKRCPNCGKALSETRQTNGLYMRCPSQCVSFTVEAKKFYKSSYFDERVNEKRFRITTSFITNYNINEQSWDSDVGGRSGVVKPSKVKDMRDAFEELRIRTLVDLPITEEAFREAIEDGKKLISNICPLCNKAITKKTQLVKGYGGFETKLVRTGYGEYGFKREYVGDYDRTVSQYTCGCEGLFYDLHEYEDNGAFYKRYSSNSESDRMKRACAFSEIYTKKKSWI